MRKKLVSILLASALIFPFGTFAAEKDYGKAKNVIVMIPDGMSIEASSMSRWMTDDFKLNLDELVTGLVRTNNANTPIADSAPAGTAMATGVKSQSPFVGCYPAEAGMPGAEPFEPERAKMPIANVMEGAKSIGKATGIVSTSNIQHATPADFSAHHPNRNNYEDLGEQQVYQGLDVVLGAGTKYLTGTERKDGEDLVGEIKNMGYTFVTNTEELKGAKGNRLWGLFADKSFAYDIDRDPAKEPSLAEMTAKALEVLSQDPDGFVLMVEGSEIDWAAHANDPVGIVSDVLAFDKAVKVAKDFADKNKDTVLIAAADHGTGGPSFGEYAISKGYDKAPLEEFTRYIKNAKLTGAGVGEKVEAAPDKVAEIMKDAYGITDLTPEEADTVKNAKDKQNAVGKIVSKRSHIGWTTGGHVGGDVALYCYSTAPNAKVLRGTVHNAEIGKYVADLLDVNLRELTDKLFVKMRPAFEAKGAEVHFSYETKGNPVVEVKKGDTLLKFPISKNYYFKNGEKQEMKGITVFNGQNVYVPVEGINAL